MKNLDVLVVGEALMDVVVVPEGERESVGGSPANVALGLGRRGVAVALLTQIGPDARGRIITEHLEASGVQLLSASTSLTRTSTAVAHLVADGSATYDFDIEWKRLPDVGDLGARILHTGSIAAFLEPGAASVRKVLTSAGADIVTFDPNIRPALVGDHAAALATFADTARASHVVKMSDEDAEWLFPGATPDEALDAVLALGPELAVMTLGSRGALLARSEIRMRVPAVEVTAVDTIGAGDTFMASLLVSFAESGMPRTETDLAAVGAAAVRAAAVTVSRAGADLPWAAELADR